MLESTIRSDGNTNFNIMAQQDVPYVLEHVLIEFSVAAPFVSELTNVQITTTATCDVCFQASTSDDVVSILCVDVRPHISTSLEDLVKSTHGNNFCLFCGSVQPVTFDKCVSRCGNILIVQLKRFTTIDGVTQKLSSPVFCPPSGLYLPVTLDEEVSVKRSLKLVSMINHYGTLENGHYTAFVKDPNKGSWFYCNDRAVVPANIGALNNTASYALFFEYS